MNATSPKQTLSVLIVVQHEIDMNQLHQAVTNRLEESGASYELVYLLSAPEDLLEKAKAIFEREPERVRVLQFAQGVSESAMLTAGIERSTGDILLTLPAVLETDLEELTNLINTIEEGSDVVVASRTPGDGSGRAQSRLFNRIISFVSGSRFLDVASATRGFRREVIDEIPLYGDYHRYLPLLADRLGFSVCEIPATSRQGLKTQTLHAPRVYFLRALDILSVLFISRFTRYPLRLFGGVGSIFAAAGAALLFVVGIQRIMGTPLADRPVLVLATLLVGLGVQAFTIGLLGELILFFHARSVRDYRILAVYGAETPTLPSLDETPTP
ncbi:MAG: glycosyltransferase [bacterium]|nr:glycosyltransferase [bacterium]